MAIVDKIVENEDGSADITLNVTQEELLIFAKIGLTKVLIDSANDAFVNDASEPLPTMEDLNFGTDFSAYAADVLDRSRRALRDILWEQLYTPQNDAERWRIERQIEVLDASILIDRNHAAIHRVFDDILSRNEYDDDADEGC